MRKLLLGTLLILTSSVLAGDYELLILRNNEYCNNVPDLIQSLSDKHIPNKKLVLNDKNSDAGKLFTLGIMLNSMANQVQGYCEMKIDTEPVTVTENEEETILGVGDVSLHFKN